MKINWGKNVDPDEGDKADKPIVDENGYIMSAIKEAMLRGDFDNLEGKGKPLNLDDSSEDYMTNKIMKNAGVLPEWLEIQHEIRSRISQLVNRQGENRNTQEIESINVRIKEYNRKCPSPLLQKPLISKNNIEAQLERWS